MIIINRQKVRFPKELIMKKKTIKNTQLTNYMTVLVRGTVMYSHITKLTTDEEREKDNLFRRDPIHKNYATLILNNAEVLPQHANNPTIEEQYVQESLYRSYSNKAEGLCYYAIRIQHDHHMDNELPRVYVVKDENTRKEIIPENELAFGLNVTLSLMVTPDPEDETHIKKVMTLGAVFVDGPIKYQDEDQNIIKKELI